MRTKFTVYSDPGHAWLQCTRAEANALGILPAVSRFSYQSKQGNVLYLEEDCDAGLFIKAYREVYGRDPEQELKHVGGGNFIRRLPRFKLNAQNAAVINPPLERLRHHVTGAIERGEKTAVTAVVDKVQIIVVDAQSPTGRKA